MRILRIDTVRFASFDERGNTGLANALDHK
jgi:hypothetical protein